MAVISGTTVDWQLSPRIITIPVSDTEVTIEDLQDTLQDLEDNEQGMVWPHLRNTSGGEDLGGGTSVGYTMELQNARLSFAARTTPQEVGTATSTGTTTLIDTTALFETNLVEAGAFLINFTDGSVATVISVDSEIQLTHAALTGGIANDWTIGDSYTSTNEVQCRVTGGNIVAVDGVGAELSPVFPTVGTQVLIASSSSATTANQTALEYAVFGGVITLDEGNVTGLAATGTEYPAGTPLQPCLNITDAQSIGAIRGIKTIFVNGTANIGATPSLDGWNFVGDNPSTSKMVFTGADTGDTSYRNLYLSGGMSGAIYAEGCAFGAITGLGCTTNASELKYCTLQGNIQIRADNNKHFHLINCSTTSANWVELDVNGSFSHISILGHQCRLRIKNVTQNNDFHISGLGMEIDFDVSITTGVFELHGDISYNDNATSYTSIDNDTTSRLVWQEAIEGTFTAEEVMRIISSALAGKATGLDTNAPVFRDISDTKDRITATTDANGNRTAVTLVGS